MSFSPTSPPESFVTQYNPCSDTKEYYRTLKEFNFALQEEQQASLAKMPLLHNPQTQQTLQDRARIVKEYKNLASEHLETLPQVTMPSHSLTDAHLIFFKTDPYDTQRSIEHVVLPMICVFPGNPSLITYDKVRNFFCSETFKYRADVSTWRSDHCLAQKKQEQDFEMNMTTGFNMPEHFYVVHAYDAALTLNRRKDLYLADFSCGNRSQFYRENELPLIENEEQN